MAQLAVIDSVQKPHKLTRSKGCFPIGTCHSAQQRGRGPTIASQLTLPFTKIIGLMTFSLLETSHIREVVSPQVFLPKGVVGNGSTRFQSIPNLFPTTLLDLRIKFQRYMWIFPALVLAIL